MPFFRLCRYGLSFFTLLHALNCEAGNISFGLSLTGATLSLTLQGDSPAFYPAAYRLLNDGRWQRLDPLPDQAVPAQLTPGAQLEVIWPDQRPLDSLSSLERMQIGMVRFFDQAGVSFGQILMFHPPPATRKLLRAEYAAGQLTIHPPAYSDGGSASWLLWPREDGIAPINAAIKFEHVQPPALRVDWHPGSAPMRVDTGAGQPAAVLLHETTQGYVMLRIPGGAVPGRQQRAAWLDAGQTLYHIGWLLSAAALLLLLWYGVSGWRRRLDP